MVKGVKNIAEKTRMTTDFDISDDMNKILKLQDSESQLTNDEVNISWVDDYLSKS